MQVNAYYMELLYTCYPEIHNQIYSYVLYPLMQELRCSTETLKLLSDTITTTDGYFSPEQVWEDWVPNNTEWYNFRQCTGVEFRDMPNVDISNVIGGWWALHWLTFKFITRHFKLYYYKKDINEVYRLLVNRARLNDAIILYWPIRHDNMRRKRKREERERERAERDKLN